MFIKFLTGEEGLPQNRGVCAAGLKVPVLFSLLLTRVFVPGKVLVYSYVPM